MYSSIPLSNAKTETGKINNIIYKVAVPDPPGVYRLSKATPVVLFTKLLTQFFT